jgi:hypothetical protein
MDWNKWKTGRTLLMLLLAVCLLFSCQSVRAAEQNAATVVALTNQARAQKDLEPLAINGQLAKAALDKAKDMLRHDYFAHTSPQGVTPWDWFDKSGYDYKYAGENLAMGFINLTDQQQAWMNSTEHRQNILNPNYQDIGVAVVSGKINGAESMLTVEEFGAPFTAAGRIPGEKVLAAQAFNKDPIPQLIPESSLPSVNIGLADLPARTAGLDAALIVFAFVLSVGPLSFLFGTYRSILGIMKKRYASAAKKHWQALKIILHVRKISIALRR